MHACMHACVCVYICTVIIATLDDSYTTHGYTLSCVRLVHPFTLTHLVTTTTVSLTSRSAEQFTCRFMASQTHAHAGMYLLHFLLLVVQISCSDVTVCIHGQKKSCERFMCVQAPVSSPTFRNLGKSYVSVWIHPANSTG
jgi:hypothetical protein